MESYDVIIIGGGPAGLKCAEVLGKTDKRVLLLEKKPHFGDKLCAGGLTLKDLEVLPLPEDVIEHRISRASIHSRHQRADTIAPIPFLFTVNRKELGTYQAGLLEDLQVEVQMNSQVVGIGENTITLKNGRTYGFRFLVGAEGYSSIVRRHLNLPVKKKLIGFQYTLPATQVDPVLEIYMDSRRFNCWYAWIFPHKNSIAVGCCCNPDQVDPQKFKRHFQDWLIKKNIDPGPARLESYPISFDYRGLRFGNFFLIGEAAGLASGLTGEGIYQSLISGREVAKMIMDPQYTSGSFQQVLKYNRVLQQIMRLLRLAGPFKGFLHEGFLYLMNRKRIRDKINANFY
jgi:flavin-dependent dehydrogenase